MRCTQWSMRARVISCSKRPEYVHPHNSFPKWDRAEVWTTPNVITINFQLLNTNHERDNSCTCQILKWFEKSTSGTRSEQPAARVADPSDGAVFVPRSRRTLAAAPTTSSQCHRCRESDQSFTRLWLWIDRRAQQTQLEKEIAMARIAVL